MTSLLPGGSLGRYQILEQIGRGGMATVFRALDPSLRREVAVKVLPSYMTEDTSFVERFSQEAQAVAGLVHPNIVRVYDFGEDKGFNYIVMEYLTGGALGDRMDRKLTLSETVEFVRPVSEALGFAHDQGVIHRDVKPNNVLLDADGRLFLADFGLARMLEGSAYLTQGGEVLGTAEYMSPEQGLGRPADQRSDLYSLGIVVCQMLLGRTPFRGDSPATTLMAHVHQPVPQPRELDPEIDTRLEPILLKSLAKEPDDRYQTSEALLHALSLVEAETDGREAPDGSAGPVPATIKQEVESREGRSTAPAHPDQISLQQARLLAIRHSQENTEFYGRQYADSRLVWEVVSEEDAGDYHEIKLEYRPAGRFRGRPGVEQFTVSKTGIIELRQILDEPEQPSRTKASLLVVIGIVGLVSGILFLLTTGDDGLDGERIGAKAATGASERISGPPSASPPAAGVVKSPAAKSESSDTPPLSEQTEPSPPAPSGESAALDSDTAGTLSLVNAYIDAATIGDMEALTEIFADDVVLILDPLAAEGTRSVAQGKAMALASQEQIAANNTQLILKSIAVEGNQVTADVTLTDDLVTFTGSFELVAVDGKIRRVKMTPDGRGAASRAV